MPNLEKRVALHTIVLQDAPSDGSTTDNRCNVALIFKATAIWPLKSVPQSISNSKAVADAFFKKDRRPFGVNIERNGTEFIFGIENGMSWCYML